MKEAADAALFAAVSGEGRVPGVVAMVADRERVLYAGTAGERIVGHDDPITLDSVLMLFSLTKPVAGTVALQLVEEDRLDLDVPAKVYVPELERVRVIEGFDEAGRPRLRPPNVDVTTRMLLLHTSGFGYELYSPEYDRLVREHGHPSTVTGRRAALDMPLLFDPGERWTYGIGVDWVGAIVEAIVGRRLGEVCAVRLFEPLGMTSTSFRLTPEMRARRARMHRRKNGQLLPIVDFEMPADPELEMAGHALYSTAPDYLRFLQMWLGDGAGPTARVLAPSTVRMARAGGLGSLRVTKLKTVSPKISHDFELFEGAPKSWGLTFMINELDAPTGRRAGSMSWAGLGNLFFWIDPATGIAGLWATQLRPFGDRAAVEAYLAFEKAVYDAMP